MKTSSFLTLLVFAAAGISCSTVHVTQVQPGRGGELAVQDGLFGEPARVKADRVMQSQCPDGYEVEQEGEVVVGSITTTQAQSDGKAAIATSETRDKTERRITWKCKGTAVPMTNPVTNLDLKQPTGWTADIAFGRRWYKPKDTAVANFHSTALDLRLLYDLLPGVAVGGDLHVDGYDNDSSASDDNFTSSLFEFGVTTKLSHRFGAFEPYLVGNYYFFGEGNREYERTIGFTTEKYSGRNRSRGADGALGLAWNFGLGSLYFEWTRSAEREMKVEGRLERQTLMGGIPYTSVQGDKRSFKTTYDGFALGLSLPISH